MSSKVEEIAEKAKELSQDEKALLLVKLSSMIDDQASGDLKSKWLDLAKDRFGEVEAGEVETIPSEDVMKEAKDRLE
ncbi:MAG: addiction module protein [bacterium]